MTIKRRVNAFVNLGLFLDKFKIANNSQHKLNSCIDKAYAYNGWFTLENIRNSISSLTEMLKKEKLSDWISCYKNNNSNKRVAVIMAGNIPLVGFHDLLCVLISGHTVIIKMSSDDNQLLPVILEQLKVIEPGFIDKIYYAENKLENFDVLIATGSDNSARYFEYYFGNYPNIIRKTRSSVAILDGSESKEELKGLSNDVFQYFGLGCRSISKVFLPNNYDLNILFNAFYTHKKVIDNKKYGNNYDYNKAIYLMGNHEIIENGFLIMKEDSALKSPVSVLYYEFYDDLDLVHQKIDNHKDQIQCVIGKDFIPFGKSHNPALNDYADGVDTMAFLQSI